jgi:flap endonuclease-1
MGVKKLYKLIEKYAPESIKTKKMSDYKGTYIAVDANIILYQFMIAILNSKKEGFINKKGENTAHYHIIFYKTISYLNNGIIPIYVFDGKPPEIKKNILIERKNMKKKAKEKLSKASSEEETIKYTKRLVNINDKHIDEIIILLEHMGIPYIKSEGEADSQCAALSLAGVVDGVASEDMDLLAFGAPILLRDFSSKKKVREINLIKVLEGLGFMNNNFDINPYELFIELCILLKCDYCPIIKGIGPEKALKLLLNYGSIKNLINYIDTNEDNYKFKITNIFRNKYIEAKRYFKEASVIDPFTIELDWKKPNKKKIIDLLCTKNNFSKKRILKNLKIVENNYNLFIESKKIY